MTEFASNLDLHSGRVAELTLEFAETVITNVAVQTTIARLTTLAGGRERRGASDVERAALHLARHPSLQGVANLLSEGSAQTGSRTYRPAVLRACLRALTMSAANPSLSFAEAATQVREENRAVGRQLPKNAIGSTLLLKGLEADHVVVLNASDLDARNLYVAMTRGAKSVTLCARNSMLAPR